MLTHCYKLLNVFVAFCFLCNSILYGAPLIASANYPASKSGIMPNAVNIHDLFIPESFGSIVKKWRPEAVENNKFVILIQDAHCNYEAQKNIAKILDTLVRDYKVDLVAIEGAAGDVDLSRFGKLENIKAKEKITDIYVKTLVSAKNLEAFPLLMVE